MADVDSEKVTLDDLMELWSDDPTSWRAYGYAAREQPMRPGMHNGSLGNIDLATGMRSWDVMREMARRLGGPLPSGQAVLFRLGKVRNTTGKQGGEYSAWSRTQIDEPLYAALMPEAPVAAAPAPTTTTTKAAVPDGVLQELLAEMRKLAAPKAEDPASMLMRLMEQADARAERQNKSLLDTLKTAGLIGGAPPAAGGIAPPSDPKFWLEMGEKIAGGSKGNTEIITALINGVAPAVQEFLAITRTGVDAKLKLEEKRLAIEETKADTKLLEASAAAGVPVGQQGAPPAPRALEGDIVDDAQQSLPLDDARAAE